MKKLTFASLVLFSLLIGCKKNNTADLQSTDEVQAIARRTCASNDVLQQQLAADPSLRKRMDDIETFTRKAIATGEVSRLVGNVIEIPVVVNVLYRTTAENISAGQIQSQIDVLNEDYQNRNADKSGIPNQFQSVDGTVGVRFVLNTAVNGTGIIRKATNKKSWSANDAMKKPSQGGIAPTNPSYNLNLWACNLGQGLLGYAQFPGSNPATDGVVILYSAFGSKAKYPGGVYATNYDLGRTASHEVGHWMNLYHIWGDDGGSCSGSDLVDDTPNQGSENYGCPTFPHVSCSNNGDMSMNYMDYTDDRCMFMFTKGQVARMLAVFAAGGPRASIGQ